MNELINKKKICPACHAEYTGYPAVSRRDNKTDICSDCGEREALEDFARAQTDTRLKCEDCGSILEVTYEERDQHYKEEILVCPNCD